MKRGDGIRASGVKATRFFSFFFETIDLGSEFEEVENKRRL